MGSCLLVGNPIMGLLCPGNEIRPLIYERRPAGFPCLLEWVLLTTYLVSHIGRFTDLSDALSGSYMGKWHEHGAWGVVVLRWLFSVSSWTKMRLWSKTLTHPSLISYSSSLSLFMLHSSLWDITQVCCWHRVIIWLRPLMANQQKAKLSGKQALRVRTIIAVVVLPPISTTITILTPTTITTTTTLLLVTARIREIDGDVCSPECVHIVGRPFQIPSIWSNTPSMCISSPKGSHVRSAKRLSRTNGISGNIW